jgi:hypothetical protein
MATTTGAFDFRFYEAEFNPTGLSGTVGGGISTTELQPRLGSFFADMTIPEVTTLYQFRKFYIKQTEPGTYQDIKVGLVNVEHSDQVTFFLDTGVSGYYDTAINALSYPTGTFITGDGLTNAHFSGNYSSSIYYTGSVGGETTVSGEYFPVWIRQEIDSTETADSLASFAIQVIGTKLT